MKRIACLALTLMFLLSALLPVAANNGLTPPSQILNPEKEAENETPPHPEGEPEPLEEEIVKTQTELALAEDPYAHISDFDLFYQGIFRVHPFMSYREFIENMMILDDAQSSKTNKFRVLVEQIKYLYYYGITEKEIMYRLCQEIDYVDFNNIEELYKALFSVLDGFSYYLSAEESSIFWEPVNYNGVGIVVHYDSEKEPVGAYIKEVYYESPAYVAGVLPEDRMVGVNDISFDGMALGAVNDALRASLNSGENILLKIERDGTVMEFDLTPSAIVMPEYDIEFFPEIKTAHISIYSFSQENTVVDLRLELYDIKAMGYENIIIDLRDNTGGNIQYAMQIAGLFLTEKKQLFTLYRADGLPYIGYFSNGLGYKFDELYILVNEKTASAAEAMTMVLCELGDAFTVGTKTYGKAVGQSMIQLYDMSTIAVTTMLGRGPSDETYNGVGLTPYLVVENEILPYEFPEDLQPLDESNYHLAVAGAENDTVLGLERRLEIIGYLSKEKADGIFDDTTAWCIKIIQMVLGYEVTGVLDNDVVEMINITTEQYRNASYIYDHQFDAVYDLITGEIKTA